MSYKTFRFITLSLVALLLTACGSTVQPKYYLLTPAPGTAAGGDQKPLQISVGPVTLPAYLDRSQIVTRHGVSELELADAHRWAEPLQKNFSAILAENLRQQLRQAVVSVYPAADPAAVDYRVTLDVVRFDTDDQGAAVLIADWGVLDGNRQPILSSRRSRYTAEFSAASGYAGRVAALSDTVAQLGRDVAAAITELNKTH